MRILIFAALGFVAPLAIIALYIAWKAVELSLWWADADHWTVPPLMWIALGCAALGALIGVAT